MSLPGLERSTVRITAEQPCPECGARPLDGNPWTYCHACLQPMLDDLHRVAYRYQVELELYANNVLLRGPIQRS